MTQKLNEIATLSLAMEWEESEEKWSLMIDALGGGGIYVTSAAARSDALVSRLEGRLQKILKRRE